MGPKREPVPIWPTHTHEHFLLSAMRALTSLISNVQNFEVGNLNLGTPAYFFAGADAISSITSAWDPPRSYNFPFAVTLPPANAINFAFCPVAGVVSAIGQ